MHHCNDISLKKFKAKLKSNWLIYKEDNNHITTDQFSNQNIYKICTLFAPKKSGH